MSDYGEPWAVDGTVIRDRDLWIVPSRNKRLAESDVERIVTCVNALAGIDDPARQVERWKAMEVLLRKMMAANRPVDARLALQMSPDAVAESAEEWTPDD